MGRRARENAEAPRCPEPRCDRKGAGSLPGETLMVESFAGRTFRRKFSDAGKAPKRLTNGVEA